MVNVLASWFKPVYGYIIVVVIIILICLICGLIRKKFQIGTYTKEEEKEMKSNLELLIKEEDIEEGRDYSDEV